MNVISASAFFSIIFFVLINRRNLACGVRHGTAEHSGGSVVGRSCAGAALKQDPAAGERRAEWDACSLIAARCNLACSLLWPTNTLTHICVCTKPKKKEKSKERKRANTQPHTQPHVTAAPSQTDSSFSSRHNQFVCLFVKGRKGPSVYFQASQGKVVPLLKQK